MCDKDISVVIPTLGGSSLKETIKYLNESTIVPYEILICIPAQYVDRVQTLISGNVHVVICHEKGQVNQRICGFKSAKCNYVMQLDDDILVDKNCITNLISELSNYDKAAISPAYYNKHSNKYFSFLSNDGLLLPNKFWRYVSNNSLRKLNGKISLSGVNFGYSEVSSVILAEWLPGGCVLHKKENLILENFYPFLGKAYLEDLYHSKLLSIKGITLVLCNSAKCYLEISTSSNNSVRFIDFFLTYLQVLKIRTNFAKKFGYSLLRLYLFSFFLIFRHFVKADK
jgi:GT2 family glycosyltransferase